MSETWTPSWQDNWGDKPINDLTVHGGVGAIRFQEEELQRGEQLLRQLSTDLTDVVAVVNGLNFQLMVMRTYAEGTRGHAVDALHHSADRLTACSAAFEDTAHLVDKVTNRYIMAEMANTALLADLRMQSNGGLPTLNMAEPLMAVVLKDSRKSLGLIMAGGWLRPAPIEATEVGDPESVDVEASFEWLLGRTQSVNSADHGMLEIIEVDNGPGQLPTFVVSIPGTQSGGATATENPFDETGIVEAMEFDSKYMGDAVRAALAEAGAEAGDVVVLGGYSQGGMHAANLAADPKLGEMYDIGMVVTAGSPVGNTDIPEGVQAVHLEHEQDIVPATDGTPNPEINNRITVGIHTWVETPDGEDAGLGPGHNLDNYMNGARLADESEDGALIGAGGALAGALRGGQGTRHRFKLKRQMPTKWVPNGPMYAKYNRGPEPNRQGPEPVRILPPSSGPKMRKFGISPGE